MKFLTMMAALFVTVSAHAAGLEMTGSVGADTNYVVRGESLSDKRLSTNGAVGLKYNGAFVELEGHGIQVRDVNRSTSDPRLELIPRFGYRGSQYGINYNTYVERNEYFGKSGTAPVSRLNQTWLGLGADYMGVFGKVDHRLQSDAGKRLHDTFYTVGYKMVVYPGLTLGVDTVYTHYQAPATKKTLHNNIDLFAEYALTKKVSLTGNYSKGYRTYNPSFDGAMTATPVKFGDQATVGVKYAF